MAGAAKGSSAACALLHGHLHYTGRSQVQSTVSLAENAPLTLPCLLLTKCTVEA